MEIRMIKLLLILNFSIAVFRFRFSRNNQKCNANYPNNKDVYIQQWNMMNQYWFVKYGENGITKQDD